MGLQAGQEREWVEIGAPLKHSPVEAGHSCEMPGGAHRGEDFTRGDFGSYLQIRGHGLVGGAISGVVRDHHGSDVIDLTDEGEGAIGGSAEWAPEHGGEIHTSMAAPITPGRRGKGAKEVGGGQREAPLVQRGGSARCRGGGGESETGGSQGQGASEDEVEVFHRPRVSRSPARGALSEAAVDAQQRATLLWKVRHDPSSRPASRLRYP